MLIARAPDVFVNHLLDTWSEVPDAFPPSVRAEYIARFRAPETIHAICEEYQRPRRWTGPHDEADRGVGRRIACPDAARWSGAGAIAGWRPLEVWKTWADDVRGEPISAGHFLPEEASEQTARLLLEFLDS